MKEPAIIPEKIQIQQVSVYKSLLEVDTELMDELRIYGVTHKTKLRSLFERALRSYLKDNK